MKSEKKFSITMEFNDEEVKLLYHILEDHLGGNLTDEEEKFVIMILNHIDYI